MAGYVGDDEAPARSAAGAPVGGEVAVGDVDRDALLALGPQAVREEREVECAIAAAALARLRDVGELILVDELRVVEQSADEGALAVIDRSGRREAQQIDGQK